MAIARELIDTAADYFCGIYLITPMGHYSMTAELVAYIKEKERKRPVRARGRHAMIKEQTNS